MRDMTKFNKARENGLLVQQLRSGKKGFSSAIIDGAICERCAAGESRGAARAGVWTVGQKRWQIGQRGTSGVSMRRRGSSRQHGAGAMGRFLMLSSP